MALFDGYDQAYGQFTIQNTDTNGKQVGKASTVRAAPGEKQFRAHLEGTGPGLGIVMLRGDNTVVFGAIDYDKHDADLAKAEQAVIAKQLPLVVCRSKSGGIHFYCFTDEPVPAALMRERLAEWTALLGMAATTEQFPKQASRFDEKDIGSWINLPYFNAADTDRYAVKHGKPLSLAVFLNEAEGKRMTFAELSEPAAQPSSTSLFLDGPPCLQMIEQQGGFSEGSRNLGMTSVAVYLRKRYPESWEEHMAEYNDALGHLPDDELHDLIKHYKRKPYNYQCKQPPIAEYCQRAKCLHRPYGVRKNHEQSVEVVDVTGLTCYQTPDKADDPIWGLEIGGQRLVITHTELVNKNNFNKAVAARIRQLPLSCNQVQWEAKLRELLEKADIVPLPEDASSVGQAFAWVEAFLSETVVAPDRAGLFNGLVYIENNHVFFRSQHLLTYLKGHQVAIRSEAWLWLQLRERGGSTITWRVNGKLLRLWSFPLPTIEEQPMIPEVLHGKDVV